jgi:sodium/potassium/calcium exchanger 6
MGISSSFNLKKYTIFLNISLISLILLISIFYFNSTDFSPLNRNKNPNFLLNRNRNLIDDQEQACEGFAKLGGYKAKCFYLKSKGPCVSQGYIDYLYLFYCKLGNFSILGHVLLILWLLVLFYLLGNTASEYFCSSLENLSKLLRLSPTIAGVTLLSLGNGAPDVFSVFVSFIDTGTTDIGLSTVLGGTSFVTCVVVGVISILVHKNNIRINKSGFIRDICFFMFVLLALLLIFVYNKTNLWAALAFSSMYVVYVLVVYIQDVRRKNRGEESPVDDIENEGFVKNGSDELTIIPFLELHDVDMHTPATICNIVLNILELPLSLPRRLTIPVVNELKWSKSFAVCSVTLAPIFLSILWVMPQDESNSRFIVYGVGLLLGIVLGVVAYLRTDKSNPPTKFLLPWLIGGFIMSVVWSYLIAQELMGLLASFGYIFGISPSILGLTILAWGNSLGDLITNITLALYGGREGAQIAISGSYAGPIFNTLVGLGFALVGSSWIAYPYSIVVPIDPYLLETLGFVAAGLIWALIVLQMRGMKLDAVLGGGLLAIYTVSMSVRLIQALGYLQLEW